MRHFHLVKSNLNRFFRKLIKTPFLHQNFLLLSFVLNNAYLISTLSFPGISPNILLYFYCRYMSFGSGPKKSPIISTLDSTLEFVRMGLNKEEEETPMTISPSSSPSSSTMQESIESSSILATAERIEGPSPKNMTAVEGNTLIDCLQRLKEEVQQETGGLYPYRMYKCNGRNQRSVEFCYCP